MKTEIITPGWIEMHFDSPLDMLDIKPSTDTNTNHWKGSEHEGGAHWSKFESYQAFRGVMGAGATRAMQDVFDKAGRLVVPKAANASLIKQNRRFQCVADSGDELDFDAWRRGDADSAWRTTRKRVVESKRRKAAVLYVNLAANANVHADDMEWRGAALVKVAQMLSASGWATEIIVGSTTIGSYQGQRERLAITFCAKSSTMPLSIERVALQSSAAWFRYCVFLAMMGNSHKYDCTWGLGQADWRVIPPQVMRMVDKGYKLIQIPGNALYLQEAQEAINQAAIDVAMS